MENDNKMTTITLDASKINTFIECPRLYYYKYIKNLTKKITGKRELSQDKGTYMHGLLDRYYRLLWSKVPALESSKQVSSELDAIDTLDKETKLALKMRFLQYSTFWDLQDDYKIATLLVNGIKQPAIEVGFSETLHKDAYYHFILEGRIDLIATIKDTQIWVDHKTQSRFSTLYDFRTQFRTYDLVTGIMGQVNYIMLNESMTDKTFRRSPLIQFSDSQRIQWREYLVRIFKHVTICTEGNLFEQRLGHACEGNYGIPCPFTEVCEQTNKRIQESIINLNFEERKEWKPW